MIEYIFELSMYITVSSSSTTGAT